MTLTERIFSACRNFGSLTLLPFLRAPSFLAFHRLQMILLKSVHCLAVGIVALRDDANPSSWLFAFYPETLLRKWKPLKQASEMARSPSEPKVSEQCDIFCNLFRFFAGA